MQNLFRNRTKRLFILKIDLPALIAFFLFAGLIFFYLIPGFERVMMDRKRSMIHEMTSSAYSIIEYYNSLELKGTLSIDEAKAQASQAISTIRYGENYKDYFWITDRYPRMIMHPYRPELNGKDLNDFHDSKGKLIFVEFVKAVTETGESYVDYMWQWNDDSTRVAPKLSYVRLFEPWGWIIGTGIYIEDVRSEIQRIALKALIISGIIGLVIVILLIAISTQSHKIEEKRNRAEEDLRKSRELYRTLAEAASEGVMIWSEMGLQANKTLLSWLGYTEEELQSVALQEIFSSPEATDIQSPETLYEELSTRRYIDGVLKMKKGEQLKSHADFSRILLGGIKAIMIVIRPVNSVNTQSDFSPPSALFNSVTTGFFRTTYGRKNKFLYATKPTVNMLGFDNFQELQPHTIESFFINPVQLKTFRIALSAKENIFRKEVLLRGVSGNEFWALVSIMVIEVSSSEIWCEGSIELLAASVSNQNIPLVDLKIFSASYIMEAPVSTIMVPPVRCPENMTVLQAALLMKKSNTQYLIINDNKGEVIGVIDAGTIGLRLASGESSESEVFRWMKSPAYLIRYDTKISEAFGLIHKNPDRCLLITSEDGCVNGIISNKELSNAFFSSPGTLETEIAESTTSYSLRNLFLDNQKIATSMVLGHADPYSVSLYISGVADLICQKVVEICVAETGEPPCRFAFIQTGSAGRMEQTLSTDQDNAIIFENREEEDLKIASEYFLFLGKKINEMLADIGYRLCKGENMAGNPKWCQPLDRWKKYFHDWIKAPGPEELLEVSIFFDFRFCYGDSSLCGALRDFVTSGLKTNDIFFHHLSAALKPFNPTVTNLSGKKTDIKKLLIPLTGIVRLYTLRNGIDSFPTIERLLALYSEGSLDFRILNESIRAWKDLTKLRLSHQIMCINKNTEPDNTVDFSLTDNGIHVYAEQAIVTINDLMLKAGNDFYTSSI